jgi:cytosine/uracil/thiamine/allantoin permease
MKAWVIIAGVPVVLGSILLTEPALAGFVALALLVGAIVAVILHHWKPSPSLTPDAPRPEIQIARIPVTGPMGVVFTIGTMAIFWMALAEVRWFFAFAFPAGILTGLLLHLWYKRHPRT